MKKTMVFLLAVLWMISIPALMLAEEVPSAPASGWAEITTQVVIWIIGGIFGLLAFAVKKWLVPWVNTVLVPWLRDVIIPWMKDKHLLSVATEAVRYAETQLGRYTGDQKWHMAKDMLDKLGWDVDSNAVIAALKSAWLTLDIEQIAAGIKEVAKDAAST
jgi:hypothetical protein